MEKKIARWSYWGGLAGIVVCIAWRVFAMLGVLPKRVSATSHTLTYNTVMKGALLLLAITIATGSYLYAQKNSKP